MFICQNCCKFSLFHHLINLRIHANPQNIYQITHIWHNTLKHWLPLTADGRWITPCERLKWSVCFSLDGPWSSAAAAAAAAAVFPVCWTLSTGYPPCSDGSILVISVDKWDNTSCCFSRTCYIGVPLPVAGCFCIASFAWTSCAALSHIRWGKNEAASGWKEGGECHHEGNPLGVSGFKRCFLGYAFLSSTTHLCAYVL